MYRRAGHITTYYCMYHTCNIIHYLTYLATFNTHLPYNRLYLPISILFKLYHYSCYIFIVISLSLSNNYICITLTVFITHISQYLYHSLFITTVSLMSITPVSLSPCLWLLVSVPESLPTCWYLCVSVSPQDSVWLAPLLPPGHTVPAGGYFHCVL